MGENTQEKVHYEIQVLLADLSTKIAPSAKKTESKMNSSKLRLKQLIMKSASKDITLESKQNTTK